MSFVRAKHARSYKRSSSKKRSLVSILLVTTLLSSYVSGTSLAIENPSTPNQIPNLCDPSLIVQPVTATPTPSETATPSPSVLETESPSPEVSPSPETNSLTQDYVAPELPAGESSLIIKTEELPPQIVCPSPVTNLIATPQNGQVLVSWTPGVSSELNVVENISDFYIKILETNEVIKVTSDKTSALVSGLKNNTKYSFVVYAASQYGSSAASEVISATPLSGNESEVAGLIIEFKDTTAINTGDTEVPGEELVTQVDLTISNEITKDVRLVEFSEPTTLLVAQEIAADIAKDEDVIWAEPDQFVYTALVEAVNDPSFPTSQWNLWDKFGIGLGESSTQMSPAWSETAGQGINVAVIDTGITSHPDLDSQLVAGFDFVSNPESLKAIREENGEQVFFDGDYINSEKYGPLGWDSNPTDPGDWRGISPVRNSTWHGTHIAGVIAAQNNNQEGIAGIAPGAKIQPIRALSWRGGLLSDIATSITWASGGEIVGVENNSTPAKVINMSFSVNSICPASLQAAINDAFARGSVLVAAAGNNNDDVKNYAPANCENVISVGASNEDGKRASYSNYGLGLDVSAPGGDSNSNGGVYSTSNVGLTEPASFGYSSQQGTSISAAHVSAIAARILSSDPALTPLDVKNQMISKESVREFADTQCDVNTDIYCGEGIVSLFQVANSNFLNPPTVSSVTSSGNQITINFSAPVFTGTITGYRVQYSTNGTTWTTASDSIAANATSYTITGLSESTSYYTRVAAKSSSGVGSFGYKWEKIYATTTPYRTSTFGAITYSTGFGLGGSDAAVTYASTSFSRVRYEMAATYGGVNNYVYADFNRTFTQKTTNSSDFSITNLRIPSWTGTSSKFEIHGEVNDLTVVSNVADVETGNGFSGILEIWPWNYSTAATSPFAERSAGTYDNADSYTRESGEYGSFQLHRYSLSDSSKNKTIFAWNRHFDATNYEIGFGNASGSHSDWTFTGTGNTRTNFSLGIFINPPIATGLAAPTITSASISGTQKIGNTLTATPGTITGSSTTTSYKWQFSNDGSTSWTDISGATSSTYAISGTTYREKYLRAVITVTNSGGTAIANSSATSQIYYADCSPTTTTPTISGVVRTVYSFTTTGTCDWTAPASATFGDLLVVGGGGGGGMNVGSGGGGGGSYYKTINSLTPGTKYTVTVGAGGSAGTYIGSASTVSAAHDGGNGETSSIAIGATTFSGTGGTGGQTYWGNNICGGSTANNVTSAGGTGSGSGGTATTGGTGAGGNTSSNGGSGLTNSITGTSTNYAAGGGGGYWNTTIGVRGGDSAGSGGASSAATGGSGAANRGGGGGGGAVSCANGGAGGSGVVIVSVVAASPTISGISPSTGSTTSGGSVTITGSNFVSGQTTATINGISLTSISVSSSTTMTAVLPTLTVGTFDLVVNNGSGSATLSSAFTAIAAPTIASATISGTPGVGRTLTATANTVTGTSVTTTYQWQSCATTCATLSNFSNISGATSSTYVLTSSEASKLIRVIITVTNSGGEATATSSATSVVIPSCTTTSATPNLTINGAAGSERRITDTGNALCTWTVPAGVSALHVLVVGGGGGAGFGSLGGGGGAGAVMYTQNYAVTPGEVIELKVGSGGAGGWRASEASWTKGEPGSDSTFETFTATGGGGGSGNDLSTSINGGSGAGGRAGQSGGTVSQTNYSNWQEYGNAGAAGVSGSGGGGGGGAFAAGSGRNGGNGVNVFGFAVGGGGAGWGTGSNTGGTGGGGNAFARVDSGAGTAGTVNTGGGGGGGFAGGSGIVVIRYANAPTITALSRTTASTAEDQSIVITGTNFTSSSTSASDTYAYSGSTVSINGVALTVSSISSTSITAVATAGTISTGTYNVVVNTTGGNVTSSASIEFVSKTTPTLTGFSNTSALFSESTKALTAPSVSGSIAGSITYTSSNESIASFASSSTPTATLNGVGTTTITATFTPTNTTLYNSTTTTLTLTVTQGNQSTLTVSSTSGTFGSALTLTTLGGTGTGSVTYAATRGTASSCTVSGTSLTAGSAGTCFVTATKAADSQYSSISSTSTTVTFAKANQGTLSMTSASSVTYGNTLLLTSSGGTSTGSTTYAVSSGTCTILGSTLTPGDAGSTCIVTATKAADDDYNAVSTSTQTITINKATQSTLTINSSSSVAYGSTISLTTTGGSGTGSVTYSKTGTCTILGSTLTPGDAGSSCVVTATKALDTNYNAISSATQTITITKINQATLTLTSTSGTFGSGLTLATSGGTTAGSISYAVTDGTASTCAISTGSLSVASAGTCLVTATMAGNTNYNAVSSTQTTVTFAKASQSSLTVSSTSGTFGTPLTLTTSGGSGDGAVTFVATPGDATSCSVSGSTLTAGSGGTCLVTATKASSTNYLVASSSQTTVTFAKRTVSLSGFSDISNKTYGDTTFTLTAPSVAGSVAGAFTYTSGTTSVATISGSTVTIVGAGTSTITATFTPTDTASYDTQTITMLLTINKKGITVTAGDKTKIYGASTPANSFTNSTLVGSDAISSLTYTYSGTNSTTAPTSVGNYTITPSSASFSTGSSNNYTITYVPSAFSITKATPTFSGFNNVSKTFGDGTFTITAPTVTGSVSGAFTYASSVTSAITISGTTVTVAGSGSSLITASFTPTDTTNYNSATTTMTISVAKATQSSLSISSSSSVNYGSTIALTTSGGSGNGAVSFAVTSGTCSISSTTLTPGNAGSTCVIQATKALDANYNVATSSTQSITVNKLSQTVSFSSTAPSSPVSGDTYTPLASASSGAIPTVAIASSSSSVCSLSAGIVSFNTSGTCLIEADSASSTNYNAATTASQSITVAKIAQTITFTQPSASSFGDSSRSMSASSSSGLALTYSRGAATTNTACSVDGSGVVTILAVGDCEVTAVQSGNSQYNAAVSVSRTFAVNAIVPSAPFITSVSAGNASATVSFSAPSSNGGATLSAYEIVAMPTSGSNITKSNCSTSASPLACTITGLTNGTTYTFKVAAINSAGTSAYSTTSGSFTPATIANSVVNLVAQPGDGTLIVNWDQPTDLGGGSFTRYDVYYKSTGSYPGTPNAQINSVSTTTTTFSGLTNGTSYDVKVVAITSANASELAGNTAEVSQYPSTVASAPTNVAASKLTATSARISWGLPLSDGGASLDATTPYVVTITGGPSAISCGTLNGRTCDITDLNPSSTYSISVKAQNRMGLGTAGTTTYLVPSNDANLLSINLKTGPNLSSLSNANFIPTFDANTTSYSLSVANTDFYTAITPTINELTATIKINGVTVTSGAARNLSLGIGANVFTVEVTAGDLVTTKTYTLTITRPKASQMPISITSSNSVNYGSTITLTTTGGSGNGLITFATTGTCTTSFTGGNHILTPGDVGSSCSIVATKATDDDYFAVSSTSQTITINKTTPTLSDFNNISKTYGDPTFTLNEPSVSGNVPGSFAYSSSNTGVVTVSGATITVVGQGSSTITATFTPTSTTNYNTVTTSLVLTVAKKTLRVTPGDKTKFFGASHPAITKSVIGLVGSEEISTIDYTYEGTGSTTFAASTTNPTNAGTYSMRPVITGLTSGSLSNYDITYDEATFTINKVSQSALSITSSTSATFGVPLTLSTSGGSGTGAITFTKVSGDCTLNSSSSTYSITPGDAGNNCVVSASKAADTNYNLVSTSDQTITIGKANQTLTFTSSAASTKVNDTYTPVVTSTHFSSGVSTSITPTITIDIDSAAICSISAGVVTFDAAGSCVISADVISSTNYNAATTTSQTITVTVVTNSTSNSNSNSNASSSLIPRPTPSPGTRPNAPRPIIRNIVERPIVENREPAQIPNLPAINNPSLRPVFPTRTTPTIPNNFDTGLAITDNLGRLPLSEPGEKQIKIGNDFVPVIETVSPEGAMTLTIPESPNIAPIEVAIQTTDIQGQNIPAPDDGIIRAVKGQTITVSGAGLTPGTTYSVWLFSEPTKLGEGKVMADTSFNKVFLIPDELKSGSHTLQINGINSDKKVVSLTTGVILTEVKQIQNVGDSNSDLIAYAILIIFFLLLIIAILLQYIRKQQATKAVS